MFDQVSKNQYTLMGFIYLSFGILLVFFSSKLFLEPEKTVDIDKISKIAINQCNNDIQSIYGPTRNITLKSGQLAAISYQSTVKGSKVVVLSKSLAGGLTMPRDADAILSLCPKLKLVSFCMGVDCTDKFSMILEYNGSFQ